MSEGIVADVYSQLNRQQHITECRTQAMYMHVQKARQLLHVHTIFIVAIDKDKTIIIINVITYDITIKLHQKKMTHLNTYYNIIILSHKTILL